MPQVHQLRLHQRVFLTRGPMTERIGQFFFRSRSFTPVPLVLIIVVFAAPTRLSIGLGAAFMALGEFFRLWGVGYAGFVTRTRNVGADTLVTSGPFAHVRNPLYVGNFFLSLGACVAFNAFLRWTLPIYILLYSVQYYFIVRLEETTLNRKFGEVYMHYKAAVPRFFPKMAAYAGASAIAFNGRVAFANERKTFISIAVLLVAAGLLHVHNPLAAWIKSLLSA
ncbi:MAG: isoprenylcysteine carboxylmethyltransferase family protein [Fibrobacterota bacterium]